MATKKSKLETVYKSTPPHPLVQWDADTKEAVFTWRGLTEEQANGVSAAVLCTVQRQDVTWRSGWTFEQLLRNNAGEPVGFGNATAETANRIVDYLNAHLPHDLQTDLIEVTPPYSLQILERGESTAFYHEVETGVLAAMLLSTTTLIWSPEAVRIEQYPERMLQVLVDDARREIKTKRDRDSAA